MSYTFALLNSHQAALKEKTRSIAGLEKRIIELFVEQWARDEELAQLRPLKTHEAELDRL